MDTGKVQGTKMIEILRYLVESKKIIALQVVGIGFEQLTFLTDVIDDNKKRQIIIDLPKGFKKAVEKLKVWELRFNFNGPDNIEYIFTTNGGIYENQEIRTPLPDYIERLQRRKNFRLLTPKGTRMCFHSKKLKGTFDLINISLGGTCGTLELKGLPISKQPLLKIKQPIYNISIIFPDQRCNDGRDIQIKKAEVVRIERDQKSFKHKYAFEFKFIDKDEKQKLIESIYQLQREYLQRR
jgi:c-di-GMP-binding flagellar brake protein YcgR